MSLETLNTPRRVLIKLVEILRNERNVKLLQYPGGHFLGEISFPQKHLRIRNVLFEDPFHDFLDMACFDIGIIRQRIQTRVAE